MKRYFWLAGLLLPLQLLAQDSTMNNSMKDSTMTNLMKDMDAGNENKQRVKIFNSERAINANTTEMVGKGKMDFRITHNFDDIDGKGGIFGRFLGLDNARDIRIGFHIGLSDRVDITVARIKGGGGQTGNRKATPGYVSKIYELGLKFLLAQQLENDARHPLSIALTVNTDISTRNSAAPAFLNTENSFQKFSDRISEAFQLIIARKFRKMSLQLNPTLVHTNFVVPNDDNTIFALGGAIRLPVKRNFSIIVDYFHPFRSKSSKDFFNSSSINNPIPFKFYDPVGISFEFITAGHVFNLNFTNATEIPENRFIPRTVSSWNKGQFRWSFTISRKFSLWRPKTK